MIEEEICPNCGESVYNGTSCVDKDGFVVFHKVKDDPNNPVEFYFNDSLVLHESKE